MTMIRRFFSLGTGISCSNQSVANWHWPRLWDLWLQEVMLPRGCDRTSIMQTRLYPQKRIFVQQLKIPEKTNYAQLKSMPGIQNVLNIEQKAKIAKSSSPLVAANLLIETVAPRNMKQQLRVLSQYIKPALSRYTENDANNLMSYNVGNQVRKAGGAYVYLPALKMKVDLSRVPGFDQIALKEFSEWGTAQLAFSKSKVPLSIQDAWNQLRTIEVVSEVFKTNPNLIAERDPYGIAPGTHLALPYQNMWKYATVGKGILGRFGKQSMRLAIPGWADDSSFFRGLNTVFHHGVYIGNGMIMHVGGGGVERLREGTHANRVGLDTLAFMTGFGKGLYIVEHAKSLNKYQIMYNLLKSPGAWNYDRQSKNCEHWATETVTGVPVSSQVERYIMNLFVLVAFVTAGSIELLMNEKTRKRHQKYVSRAFNESRKIASTAIEALESKIYWQGNAYRQYATKLASMVNEPVDKVMNALEKAAK